MAWRAIESIGIELEGGWQRGLTAQDVHPHFLKRDGSVVVHARYVGEIASAVLQHDDWEQFVRAYCPEVVNESCGLHVHVRLKTDLLRQQMMDGGFLVRLRQELRDYFHPLPEELRRRAERRLLGHIQFCRMIWKPEEQMLGTQNRYTAVNFHPYRDQRKTVEIRVLPGINAAEIAVGAIRVVLEQVEEHLRDRREVPIALTLVQRGEREDWIAPEQEPRVEPVAPAPAREGENLAVRWNLLPGMDRSAWTPRYQAAQREGITLQEFRRFMSGYRPVRELVSESSRPGGRGHSRPDCPCPWCCNARRRRG